ncbi:hypothetical protein HK097_000944 [Rhizophlyctis rosea]|uniref:Uncharacterized protein n=1 Tax=Rhizophlyctis rosea TaxID=64517 RepID=A0AAD5S648_9FUNG|nr:hypothetical protein HK097_000944 [Rhizophlyctis rosea]
MQSAGSLMTRPTAARQKGGQDTGLGAFLSRLRATVTTSVPGTGAPSERQRLLADLALVEQELEERTAKTQRLQAEETRLKQRIVDDRLTLNDLSNQLITSSGAGWEHKLYMDTLRERKSQYSNDSISKQQAMRANRETWNERIRVALNAAIQKEKPNTNVAGDAMDVEDEESQRLRMVVTNVFEQLDKVRERYAYILQLQARKDDGTIDHLKGVYGLKAPEGAEKPYKDQKSGRVLDVINWVEQENIRMKRQLLANEEKLVELRARMEAAKARAV